MGLLYPTSTIQGKGLSPKQHYTYTARCVQTGLTWRIPRTDVIENAARELMEQLKTNSLTCFQTRNLYGILLVQTAAGDSYLLKGFSGVEAGQGADWVPPLTAQARLMLIETRTLARLERLKQQLVNLTQLPVHTVHRAMVEQHTQQLEQLAAAHRQKKQKRDRARANYQNSLKGNALSQALIQLRQESQQDSRERRHFKQQCNQAILPLTKEIDQANQHIRHLKQEYTQLSQQWQAQMQAVYRAEQAGIKPVLTYNENSLLWDTTLEKVCHRAAAKLLHYAATHQLTPIALAEFWWRHPQTENAPEKFYEPPPADCQILMQLSQSEALTKPAALPLPILYQDDTLIVVNKPARLPSIPGRRYHLQDSVLSRLRCQFPDHNFLQVVHRLDQATSGVMALAKSPNAHQALAKQFARRQVHKTYEAVLAHPIKMLSGVIELPLWGNPEQRPRQTVSTVHGKPSVTYFKLLRAGDNPRVQLEPHTGRTHQLRVHAAQGLNSPILGDSLYGTEHQTKRLHLHAKFLQFTHPVTQERLQFSSDVPF